MVSKPGSNIQKLFANIKDIECDSSCVAPLKKDGISYSEPMDQVEILNEQSVSAFSKEDKTSMPTMGSSTANAAPPVNIQVNGAKKLPLGQNHHKAVVPDQVLSKIPKEDDVFNRTIPSLTLIYQASYEQGQIPDDWKRAFMTPSFKKGDKSRLLIIG